MATVIDALLVTLGLDSSGFKKGADDAAKAQSKLTDAANQTGKAIDKQEKALSEAQVKRAKELDTRSKSIAQGFAKMRNEALALFAAFTGGVGIKNFFENTLKEEAGLQRMSANLGMSAVELAKYQLANERAGGSMAGMTEQIKAVNAEVSGRKFGEAWTDVLTQTGIFAARAGVAFDPDKLKSGNDLMKVRSDILKGIIEKFGEAEGMYADKKMGGSEDTYNLRKNGSASMEAQAEAQKDLAEQMARNGPAAEEFRKKWNDLEHSFKAMAIETLPKLMPYLDRLVNWFIAIIPEVKAFAKKIDEAVQSVGGWTTVLIALGALKVLSMVSSFTLLAGALMGVSGALSAIAGGGGVLALGALAAYMGYKGAEWIDSKLNPSKNGLPQGFVSEGPKTLEELNASKKNPIGLASKSELLAEAARQRAAAGLPPIANQPQADAAALFARLEKRDGLAPGTLDAMWAQESDRGKNMLSSAGAKGHFQFMDPTAKQYGLKNPNDLAESADAASRMMADLLKKYNGDMKMALAAYNGGQGNLDRKGMEGMPTESKDYAKRIMSRMGAKNAAAAANMPTGAATSQRGNASGNNTSTTEVKIGQQIINTKATDAPGIAKAIGGAMNQYAFLAQANTGLA
jgi:hypothetical protein